MAEGGSDKDQKTEAPSERKLQEARERGQVVSSREVATFMLFAAGCLGVIVTGSKIAGDLTVLLRNVLASAATEPADPGHLGEALTSMLATIGITLAPLVLLLLAAPVVAVVIQNAVVWSPTQIAPKFDRISPVSGMKRLFSLKSFLEFGKGLLKLTMLGAAGGSILWGRRAEFLGLDQLPALPMLDWSVRTIILLLAVAAGVALLIAMLDYGHRWIDFMREMRMSLQEVKDEHKQSEGDPVIKQRLRAMRLERARQRMMADVPKSTVVITNPTHFAVALRYVPGETPAPKVMAKGADEVAARIRETARSAGVAIFESPPLARALFAAVDIGDLVPPDYYQAVAEIVGFVMRADQRRRG